MELNRAPKGVFKRSWLQIPLSYIFVFTFFVAVALTFARVMIGTGWSNTLVVEISHSSVIDGRVLKCVVFRDGNAGLVCVAIEEETYMSGKVLQGSLPAWLSTYQHQSRLFVKSKELVLSRDHCLVICSGIEGNIYQQNYSSSDMNRFYDWPTLKNEWRLFQEVEEGSRVRASDSR